MRGRKNKMQLHNRIALSLRHCTILEKVEGESCFKGKEIYCVDGITIPGSRREDYFPKNKSSHISFSHFFSSPLLQRYH